MLQFNSFKPGILFLGQADSTVPDGTPQNLTFCLRLKGVKSGKTLFSDALLPIIAGFCGARLDRFLKDWAHKKTCQCS